MFKHFCALALCVLVTNTAYPQLASDADSAQKLLDEVLLTLDELSTSYCVQFEGTMAEVHKGNSTLIDVEGYAAVSGVQSASYRSFGRLLQPKPQTDMSWTEVLRVKPGSTLWKSAVGKGRLFANTQERETEEELKKNGGPFLLVPQLDPFGLVFGTETDFYGRESAFARHRNMLLNSVLLESKQNSRRNVTGKWIGPNKKFVIAIEFDRTAGNMPSAVLYHTYNAAEGKLGDAYGGSRSEWQKYGTSASFVPKRTTIFTRMPDGRENEFELNWNWLDLNQWEKDPVDFESLSKSPIWYTTFDDLFADPT